MDELSSRMEGTEEGISEPKDGTITINNLNSRENRLKKRKTEQNLGDLCDDDETAVMSSEVQKKGRKGLGSQHTQIMVGNFPVLARDGNLQIQEAA